MCSFFRIVVRLRRRSPPPDARDAIPFLSVAERVNVPLRCSQEELKCRRPRLFLFLLFWDSFYTRIFPSDCLVCHCAIEFLILDVKVRRFFFFNLNFYV